MKHRRSVLGASALLVVGLALVGWVVLVDAPTPMQPITHQRAVPQSASGDLTSSTRPLAEAELASPPSTSSIAPFSGPVHDRVRADQIRALLMAQHASTLNGSDGTEPPLPSAQAPALNELPGADPALRHYVDRLMREQFVPLTSHCYEALLSRDSDAAGAVELALSIMGAEDVGAVVVDAALGPDSTLHDTQFSTCVRDAMYAVVVAAPPEGHTTVAVKQSLELSP